jgi:hypothetical protein
MSIFGLRILPPFAIARFGSSREPLDNYTIEENPEHPLDFRPIKGAETLLIDERTGEVAGTRIPETVEFKRNGKMRPVAPFLEVFAQTDPDPSKPLEPLTLALLAEHGLGEGDVKWCVTVANRKVVRRTNNLNDLVAADTGWFSSHDSRRLEGHCKNFIAADRFIDFGRVRYIKPNQKFPQIRLRFTPAQGLIYGPDVGVESAHGAPLRYQVPTEQQIYDQSKGWLLFASSPVSRPKTGADRQTKVFYNETLPPSLFAIFPPAPPWLNNDKAVSRGYLDDACDGFVEARLTLKDGNQLDASARICAAPPVVVPDSLFVRTLMDDLEQVIEGPEISANEPYEVIRAKAEDIVRRAYETVRLMNVAVMNGNAPEGRPPLSIDTKPADEAGNTDRLERPVLTPATVDTLAIMTLHQQVFAALRSGAMPWFLRILRQPEEVADFTNEGRRKMPALMCGADDNYLALSRRQIDTIRAASDMMAFTPDLKWQAIGNGEARNAQELTPRNRTAHVGYAAAGNPVSSRPVNAIANCCPGLEVDFRAVWRRIFEGITLREYDNLVTDVDAIQDDPRKAKLKWHRLLRINGTKVMAQMKGPSPDGRFENVVLATQDNPDGVVPLEWSNALARILHENAGQSVTCDFTAEESRDDQVWWDDDDDDDDPPLPPPHITLTFKIRPFFEGETAVISRTLAEVGELTQGLCSPWQNDYRECSCYYWAAARPDYVNVEPAADGMSQGDNWLQKEHTGHYVPDDYVDSRLIMYDNLFLEWEKWLRMVVRGRDVPEAPEG